MTRRSEQIAEALREQPPRLDDVGRARLERDLIEAVRGERESGSGAQKRGNARWVAVGGVAALAAAAVLAFALLRGDDGGDPVAETEPASASFQSFQDGETVRRGAFAEGETVRTAARQRVEVRLPDVRVDVTPTSLVRFGRIRGDDVEVTVERGAVELEFHPERRGEQTLAVVTPAARVEVVGTVFRVEVDEEAATTVRVEQGTVRVVPADGAEPRLVRAGEATRVARSHEARAAAEPRAVEAEQAPEALGAARTSAPGPSGEALAGETPAAEPADAEEAEAATEATEAEPAESAPPLSLDARFDLADRYLERGAHSRARHILYQIARSPERRFHRVRAWWNIADSFEREGDYLQAAEAYRRAADLGTGTLDGRNAIYALARVRDRHLGDADGAKTAYRRYIDEAARAQLRGHNSPHIDLSRRALCRLGEAAYCRGE